MSNNKKVILVIEDSPENIDVIIGILSPYYEIRVAIDGVKALKILETLKPNLILLDIMMPGMDGFEVCKRIKENALIKEIPIIYLTAKSDIEAETKGLSLGAVDFISKPISAPILQARIAVHLQLQDAYQQLKQQNINLIETAKLREDVQRITEHDLKNPLGGIMTIPTLLKMDDNLTNEQVELLDSLETCAYRMLNMINLSLDLYKMEVGSYQYKPVTLDLILLLEQGVFNECHNIAEAHKVKIELNLNNKKVEKVDQFLVLGEELLCHCLFSNLIKNAIEASNQGDVVKISLSIENDYANISIHNKGVVPEKIREAFFDKYITSGKSGGTGLGTYSSALLAKTQNGKISMKSTPEEGTILVVELIPK